MKGSLLLFNLKLNCLIFFTSLNSSLIIFIRTHTVNYRNALDRLRVRMNIILLLISLLITNFELFTMPQSRVSIIYKLSAWKFSGIGC